MRRCANSLEEAAGRLLDIEDDPAELGLYAAACGWPEALETRVSVHTGSMGHPSQRNGTLVMFVSHGVMRVRHSRRVIPGTFT